MNSIANIGKRKPVSFLSMFISPLATFDSLRDRPRWFFPVLLSAIVSGAANFYIIQRIGLIRLIKTASQSNRMIDPQIAVQNVLDHQNRIFAIQAVSVFVNVFVIALMTAVVFWLLLTILGHNISFKKSLAAVSHANMLPIIVRGCMTALAAAIIQDAGALNLRNPLATNIAFFLRPSSPVALRLLTSLDAITFANAILLAMGLKRVCPQLSVRAALAVVFICWAAYIGVKLFVPFFSS
jgi:hypothetical protein